MDITRHLGTIHATGTRCVVVFRELPGETQNCLVYEADSLPEFYRDAISRVVMTEGQRTRDLYEVLSRNQFSDGTVMLNALHRHGFLHKRGTHEIMMNITRDATIRLDQLNEQIREQDAEHQAQASTTDIQKKFNPLEDDVELETATIAEKLLKEATKLEMEARSKRKRAHTLDPSVAVVEERRTFYVDVGDMPIEEAIDAMEQLKTRLGIQPEVVVAEPVLADGVVAIDLNKSQRQVLEEVKALWRAQNPDKTK